MTTQTLHPSIISTHAGGSNDEYLHDLVTHIDGGGHVPPVAIVREIVDDRTHYHAISGWHRIEAHAQLNRRVNVVIVPAARVSELAAEMEMSWAEIMDEDDGLLEMLDLEQCK